VKREPVEVGDADVEFHGGIVNRDSWIVNGYPQITPITQTWM